jgi:SAM-dependent methyltransferase
MDAELLDFPEATFDTVLCGFALFFFPNLRATLAQFLHVLKPGGRLAVSTWGRDDERWAWLCDLRRKFSPPQFGGPQSDGPDFNRPEAMQTVLRESGLTQVQAIEEEFEFMYADEDEWLAVQWSHGMRYLLEAAEPATRDQLRAQAFAHLQAQRGLNGIPHRLGVLYTIGVKP